MKFAKEIEQDLVPEWRIKYLNYKAGKKYVKAVARAINRANGTPSLARRADLPPRTPNIANLSGLGASRSQDGGQARIGQTPPRSAPLSSERDRLATSAGDQLQYGSFVPTPPRRPSVGDALHDRNKFELPAPAIKVPSRTVEQPKRPSLSGQLGSLAARRSISMGDTGRNRQQSPTGPTQTPSTPARTPRQRLVRIFTTGSPLARRSSRQDIGMQSLDEVSERERELFSFLDSELDKVETFYQQKEDQAGRRLDALREQLREMRNRRIEELAETRRHRQQAHHHGSNGESSSAENGKDFSRAWIDPIKDKLFKPGPNSKALQKMTRTPVLGGRPNDADRRDYMPRPLEHEVPYRTAKRKLKMALQEFYRGLELLKSYALLNRTAFRKINKKYDKAVNARPPYRYMTEKVNKAWFVNSDAVDHYITTVEDLYARYFERGNHKIAAGKLRSLTKRRGDQSPSAFRSGIEVGVGCVFAVQGLAYGADLLFHPDDPVMRQQTSYLLQIYGGYFLMLYLFVLFCLDCRIWTRNKINYPFIFEFDQRHQLDWRQLAEFPSFFLLLFGVCIWFNFSGYGTPKMFLYYPVILIFVSLVILCFPAPIFRHRSRSWFLYSHWRLFFAGIYPVEFRDFFFGDMYCSLTYALCNVELYFCLYAKYWNDPEQCNSNHSRLLGFFVALPPIWRALQCLRRYHDTRNVFPHLVNCGKYTMSILAAVFLSVFRINYTNTNLALFITFATINSVYCSFWDIFMDFSLLQPNSRHRLLRDITALRPRWKYYAILVADPLLRFAWIFYTIFTHDTQHSTVVSFLVAFAEVTRRGAWTLFRVENEHCANVAQYRASRDVPLPYQLEPIVQRPSLESSPDDDRVSQPPPGSATLAPSRSAQSTGVDVAAPGSPAAGAEAEADETGTMRRRRPRADTLSRMTISRMMAEAHKQDFEKKRKPDPEARGPAGAGGAGDGMNSDEDDDDELRSDVEQDAEEAAQVEVEVDRAEIGEAEALIRSARKDGEADSLENVGDRAGD